MACTESLKNPAFDQVNRILEIFVKLKVLSVIISQLQQSTLVT